MSEKHTQGPPAGGQIFTAGKNCWRTARAERFGWCVDGEDYFRALRSCFAKAEREILIVGWDIDSRVELIRDEEHPDYPSPLCETLQNLRNDNSDLCVRILSWDFAVVYMLERELLPAYTFGWQTSERLHFQLDGKHSTGASHHQKIVIVDGAVAFSGGIDLTKCRWDTRGHAAGDERRNGPTGETYRPFHDVQAVVTGEAARALRELVSDRWQNATGDALPELAQTGSAERVWPDEVEVRARDASVAIARTWVPADGSEPIQEVETLYRDMISAARDYIYIENQYFTSATIAAALALRLRDDDGPEVVLVLPGETSGWLEQATMDVLRNRALAHVHKADLHERLRVLSPVSDELGDTLINVHAKLMVVDGRWARIGSANLSRRSMGLDSECDIVVDADDGDAAQLLCADLLGEHLDAEPKAIAESLSTNGLIASIEKFNGKDRRLEPLHTEVSDVETTLLEPIAKIADLEKPVIRSDGGGGATDASGSGDEDSSMHTPASGWIAFGLIALVAAFWGYWAVSGAQDGFNPRALLDRLRELAAHPLAPFAALPAFVLGSLVIAPVVGMIAVCALLFPPWIAAATALTGTLLATVSNHWVGGHFGQFILNRVPDAIENKIRGLAEASDVWSLASLRLIPIAPFTVVNVVVGASGVRLRDFLLGTLIAMGPGIVLICLSVDRARAALSGEPVFDPWIIAAIAAAAVAFLALRIWQKKRSAESR
jgi:phosphatidylserine/phosphatidylglycerophosphate/cardiolipin synthase-like enzyme/uncharacterized membrane protein YdjX (TVP38/TMEM64 family)